MWIFHRSFCIKSKEWYWRLFSNKKIPLKSKLQLIVKIWSEDLRSLEYWQYRKFLRQSVPYFALRDHNAGSYVWLLNIVDGKYNLLLNQEFHQLSICCCQGSILPTFSTYKSIWNGSWQKTTDKWRRSFVQGNSSSYH